jgi:hypothetical protein
MSALAEVYGDVIYDAAHLRSHRAYAALSGHCGVCGGWDRCGCGSTCPCWDLHAGIWHRTHATDIDIDPDEPIPYQLAT